MPSTVLSIVNASISLSYLYQEKRELQQISHNSLQYLVGMTGFEPATPRPPDVCATGLRHIPIYYTAPGLIWRCLCLSGCKCKNFGRIVQNLNGKSKNEKRRKHIILHVSPGQFYFEPPKAHKKREDIAYSAILVTIIDTA